MRYTALAVMALMVAVMALMVLSGTAGAQNEPRKDPLQAQYEAEKKAQDEIAKRYDETLKRTKPAAAAPASNDPWASVRPAPSSNKK